MTKREQSRRAAWYQAFESAVVALRPDLAGRIKWSEVEYACLSHADVDRAAQAYVERERV